MNSSTPYLYPDTAPHRPVVEDRRAVRWPDVNEDIDAGAFMAHETIGLSAPWLRGIPAEGART